MALVEAPILYVVHWKMQAELIKRHCMGECGKILVGEFHFPECGVMLGCKEEACPFVDDEMDDGMWELPLEGLRNIVMRKLKARS